MEGWIKTQRGWMYLEPIFSSDDIKKKLPREKEKFDQIDKNWRATVEQFIKEPFLWEAIDTDKYKLEFDTNNKLLEEIQKSLSEYLETKRRFFPRFFFLSDEELLEILAQTKDPLTVQKHINKCFEAINQLYFQEGSPDEDGKVHMELVTQMISPEKETVRMIRPINVNEGEKRGNVERWLSEIEQVMVETLRRLTLDSIKDTETPRPEWIKRWPG
jgi:dynein heavy chain